MTVTPKADAPDSPSAWLVVYWFRFKGGGLPVILPAMAKTKHFRWRRIHGVQIGSWFFGAIEGAQSEPWVGPVDPTTQARETGGRADG